MSLTKRRARAREWLDVIREEVTGLLIDNYIFWELQQIWEQRNLERLSGIFPRFVVNGFITSMVVGIRKQAKGIRKQAKGKRRTGRTLIVGLPNSSACQDARSANIRYDVAPMPRPCGFSVVQPWGRDRARQATTISTHRTAAEAFAQIDHLAERIARTCDRPDAVELILVDEHGTEVQRPGTH